MNRFDWIFFFVALATYVALSAWFQMGVLSWDFVFFLLLFSSLSFAIVFGLYKINSAWYARLKDDAPVRQLYLLGLAVGAIAAATGAIQALGRLSGPEINLIGGMFAIAVLAILLKLHHRVTT